MNLKNIKFMRESGFSIDTIQSFVKLFIQGSGTREERKNIFLSQRESLIRRIAELQKGIKQIDEMIEPYNNGLIDELEQDYWSRVNALNDQAKPQ
jgi:DNA-binding transcriptional MerR regulator